MESNTADPLELSDGLRQYAFEKYGETPLTRRAKLDELREKIALLPIDSQLKDVSDFNLIRFLRVRKFNVDRALELTVNLARFTIDNTGLCGGTPLEYQVYSKFYQILKDRDVEGRTIVVLRIKNMMQAYTTEFQKQHPLVRGQLMMLDRLSRDEHVQVFIFLFPFLISIN